MLILRFRLLIHHLSQGASSSISGCQRQNRFYALPSHQEIKSSLNFVTGMFHAFHLDVYVLLDSVTNHSYVAPLVTVNFRVGPKNITKPFSISTLVCKLIIGRRVYMECPITILHKITLACLIELEMLDFDVIIGMDCLYS